MGIYLNPGSDLYEEAVRSKIFVDKTEMIGYVNSVVRTKQKYICVSRPRRFGKTIAADMLCAYYNSDKSREIFEKSKLSKLSGWDEYVNCFDVIRIVMTDFLNGSSSINEAITYLVEEVIEELMSENPEIKFGRRKDLRTVTAKIFAKTRKQFVIIIDEWDAVFRERKEDKEGQVQYLDFLRDWLKDKDYVALAYMTGILPIKKYGKHSALNMFNEYSMTAPLQLAPYTAFTEDEVIELCEKYHRSFDEMKEWYDGYVVSDIIPPNSTADDDKAVMPSPKRYHLYNPLSVVNAVTTGLIYNYWNKTENYEALAVYIRMNFDGLKDAVILMMDGGRVPVDISTYQNDMTSLHSKDDVLALLIHLGYLGYDDRTKQVFIPNREILDEFRTSTKTDEWTDSFKAFKTSQELLNAVWNCNETKAAELLELAHDKADNKTYNNEAALSYAVRYAFYAAQKYYTEIPELDSGKGYADIAYLPSPEYPDKPAILVELKYDKSVKAAADQIHSRNYPERLEHYKDNLLIVSINYDKDVSNESSLYKHHSCKIEKYSE